MKVSTVVLGHLLQELREKAHLKQENVAMAVGCSGAYICKLEQGHALPSVELTAKLEQFYQLKPGTLIALVIAHHLPVSTQVETDKLLSHVFARSTIAQEDMTLLSEENWQLLRNVIEPLAKQLIRQHVQTVRQTTRLTHKFIFVVDDERKECLEIADFLHRQGFKTDYALDGREALKRIVSHRERPDLILLDLRMPKMNGPKLLHRLQHKLKLRSKILVLTAYPGDLADILADPTLKTEGMIEKPIILPILQEKIEQLLC